MSDFAHIDFVITAPRPVLEAVKCVLSREILGATSAVPFECRDWLTDLHVRYCVDENDGIVEAHQLAIRFPAARIVMAFAFDLEERSGIARWAEAKLVSYETDDPLLEANHDELKREAILITSMVDDHDSVVISRPRWEAVCMQARCYGWDPNEPLLDAVLRAPRATHERDCMHSCGYYEVELGVLPQQDVEQFTNALQSSVELLGTPLEIQRGLGLRNESPLREEVDFERCDCLDRATPLALQSVIELGRIGGPLRIARLCKPPAINE